MRLKSEKYSIAWFKLAELVSRKEKEKALGLYRLLFHALEDKALGYQLEGDLLFAFSDKQAIESYYKAASFYEKNFKLIQAANLYENMHALAPERIEFSLKLVSLYTQLNNLQKVEKAYKSMILSYIINHDWIHIDNIISNDIEKCKQAKFYGYTCLMLLDYESNNNAKLNFYLDKTINQFTKADKNNINNKELQSFLLKLKEKNNEAYNLACNLIKNYS